jgi:hypothetical protein
MPKKCEKRTIKSRACVPLSTCINTLVHVYRLDNTHLLIVSKFKSKHVQYTEGFSVWEPFWAYLASGPARYFYAVKTYRAILLKVRIVHAIVSSLCTNWHLYSDESYMYIHRKPPADAKQFRNKICFFVEVSRSRS